MSKPDKAAIYEEFSNKILRLSKSEAYLDYCEEVYGYRIPLFNMMDQAQLDFVMHSIPISKNDTVVDLGCGPMSILRLLTEKYGCTGTGIDQLEEEIAGTSGGNVSYIKGDIDTFFTYHLNPTVTLCIDSLYFSADAEMLIRQLRGICHNRLYLFYSQYLFGETCAEKSMLECGNTTIGAILNRNGIPFTAMDYSENEFRLYEASLRALQKYAKAFEAEGNGDLWENKRGEDALGLELYEKGCACRYLYIVEANS